MDSKRSTAINEISVTDGSKSHGGVRRCRDTEEVTSSGSGKRRKHVFLRSEIQWRSGVDMNSPELVVSSSEFSGTCDHVLSSSCFTNCLSLDLKAELRSDGNGGFRESSLSSEICSDSDKMESSSTTKNKAVTSRRQPPATAAQIPTAAEIDEFFNVAQKEEHKRFIDKYNFDILNDVPIDGRYQWVRLKP
ncbi:hypothetical protein SSX86_021065 [Deinandra increscens subsp. villosa]|uniref:Cyclin-dependent kinase inhibitor n=1 Tax=Deinandra increscens subsp. villosa TaxID=3103831 RepID=A0AAP0GSS2_9ASTR